MVNACTNLSLKIYAKLGSYKLCVKYETNTVIDGSPILLCHRLMDFWYSMPETNVRKYVLFALNAMDFSCFVSCCDEPFTR